MAKKICSLMLLCLWMLCIFAFSAQPAEESSALSNAVKEKIVEIVQKIFPSFGETAEGPDGDGLLITLIRKSAHFFSYFLLGILAVWTFSCYGMEKNRWLWAFLLCVLYAVGDEIHQLFVPGRAGRIGDVCIDSAGAALGLMTVCFVKKRKKCLTK